MNSKTLLYDQRVTPRTIKKIMAWVSKGDTRIEVNTAVFFAAASVWKYGSVSKQHIDQCVASFEKYKIVPCFVEEFVRRFVFPALVQEGGKKKVVLLHRVV